MRAWCKKHVVSLAALALAAPLGLTILKLVLGSKTPNASLKTFPTIWVTLHVVNMVLATACFVLALTALKIRAKDADRISSLGLVALGSVHLSGLHLLATLVGLNPLLGAFLNAALLVPTVIAAVTALNTPLPNARLLGIRVTATGLALVVLTTLLVPLSNNLVSPEQAIHLSLLLAHTTMALPLPTYFLVRHLQNRGKPDAAEEKPDTASWVIGCATAIGVLSSFIPQQNIPLASFVLAWIPLPWLALKAISSRNRAIASSELTARLPSPQARRFLQRYLTAAAPWAATVGMRTVNFIVDHDPFETGNSRLTATLHHVRKEEIERFVQPILNDKLLYKKTIGNRIHGTIDPENTIRPCLDALSLFSCIYLDAISLIERRLKNLTALFPIIDPELAKAVTPDDIEKPQSHKEWLFYFNYDWIDERIVASAAQANYNLNFNDLHFSTRGKILANLSNKNRMGNFIWVGDAARERIIFEAPYLAGIIELFNDKGGNAGLHFIRFEELIPRLQKYFTLEKSRRVMRDYEASAEGQRFLYMLELNISRAESPEKALEALTTITQHAWHGFKERDYALRLVLKAFERCQHFFQTSNASNETRETFRQKFQAAVEEIGFPGQLLYQAHTSKRAIRAANRLQQICLDSKNHRFAEGWLFLATFPADRFPQGELSRYASIIDQALSTDQLPNHPLVSQKVFEAFFNIAVYLTDKAQEQFIAAMVNRLARHLIACRGGVDLCCFFIDSKIHLEDRLNQRFKLEANVLETLTEYLISVSREFNPRSSEGVALTSRIKLLRQTEEASAA